MKKVFLFAFVAFMSISVNAQQVPNGNFENGLEDCYPWEKGAKVSTAHGKQPKNWCTSNVPNSAAGEICTEEITGSNGKGVKLNNVDALGNGIPAYMTLGTTWATAEANIVGNTRNQDGGVFGGVSFSYHPDALSLKYKRDEMSDISVVSVYAWKGTWTQKSVPSNTAIGLSYGTATKVTMTDRDANILDLPHATGGEVTKSADAELVFYSNKEITDAPSTWTELVIPIEYKSSSTPTKMNIVIATSGYQNNGSITSGKCLYVDDVTFIYYSELKSATYNGTPVSFSGTSATVDAEYDESKLVLTSNGRGAIIEKSFDANTCVLTITVKGEDFAINSSNSHKYTIQFKKPIVNRTISFVVDGVETKFTIAEGEATTKPADPSKVGYTFAGWSPTVSDKVTGDATYTATWNANKHNIVYKVDGQVYKTIADVEYGSSIQAIDAPVKEGYKFSGWSAIPSTMPDSDVEITGSFTINEYTITFHIDDETKNQTVKHGEMPTPPADPTKEGYKFEGWGDIKPATEDASYTALWSVVSYKLVYLIDGESYNSSDVNYNAAITPIPNSEPVKEGYTFGGWMDDIPANMPAHDVTINGKWIANKYNVIFISDEETLYSENLEYGTSITAPSNPTKEGYTFIGWTPKVDATVPAHDVTYTAEFNVNQYQVTFTIDGQSVYSEKLNYGTTIVAPANPTKEGCEFLRWDPAFVDGTTVPANDITYSAVFGQNAFIVTYKVDGKEYTTSKIEFGASVPAISEPTKEGYTFSGWTGIPSTMPAENVEVNGTFIVNNYTVSFVDEDGSVYSTESVEYGTAIKTPDTPVKEGFEFAGWNPIVDATVPAHDVTYKATWKSVVIDAIASVSTGNDMEYYTTNGVRLAAPRKGVNIVKFGNGQIKKIFVK